MNFKFIYLFITFYQEYLGGESIREDWFIPLYDIEMLIKFCVFLEFCVFLDNHDKYYIGATGPPLSSLA